MAEKADRPKAPDWRGERGFHLKRELSRILLEGAERPDK
jgi:hypothetical protein